MNAIFSFPNLIAYSFQLSLLVITGTVVPWMLRLKSPQVMYAYWRSLLMICLLLPFLQPWRPVRSNSIQTVQSHAIEGRSTAFGPSTNSRIEKTPHAEVAAGLPKAGPRWDHWSKPFQEISGWVLLAGIVAQLLSLLLGYWRLSRYRRSARRLLSLPEVVVEALDRIRVYPEIYISGEIDSPVTFGLFRASVLLPVGFLEMAESHQNAIVTHELLHVRRRDWLSTLIEELIRGFLWFEPGIWWLLDRIQLFREHVVDLEVVKHTQAPKDYVQALLEVATAKGRWEMSPAPLFLARQQLLQRVAMILQGVSLSRKRLVLSLAANAALLTFVGGLVLRAFPLTTVNLPAAMQTSTPEVKQPGETPDSISVRVPRGEGEKSEGINLGLASTEVISRRDTDHNGPLTTNTQAEAVRGTGSISGRVTVGTDPASGVLVGLYSTKPESFSRAPLAKSTSDKDGRYILANLPPGSYRLKPEGPHYVLRGGQELNSTGRFLTLGKGEKAQQIDFELIKGAAISGRLTEIDGQPLSDGMVNLSYIDERGYPVLFMSASPMDDQGNYRLDKLPPGRYLVSIGEYGPDGIRSQSYVTDRRPLTYYPGVADRAQAKIIELAAETEVKGIDMKVGPAVPAFKVSGRVLDSTTGAPVANIGIEIHGDRFSSRDTSNNSNATGEYHVQDLVPGRYALRAVSRGDLNYTSELIPFEVADKDLKGVDITVVPGATINGQVVLQGTSDPNMLERLVNTEVLVTVRMPDSEPRDIGPLNLNPDGILRIRGLPPGKAWLSLYPMHLKRVEFSIQRLEIDGAIPTEGIELKSGKEVSGVRLVLAHGTGTLNGKMIVHGGEPPTGTRFRVSARQIAPGATGHFSQVEADMRSGQFFFDSLPVGDYSVSLFPLFPPPFYENHPHQRIPQPQQSVTVTEGSQAEVTLVFDLGEGEAKPVPPALKGSKLKITKWEGGSVMTDSPTAPEISRPLNWYVINDVSSPIQLENTGITILQHGESFSYVCRGIATTLASSRITEVEVRFMLFDAHGTPLKTLSRTEKTNLSPDSSFLLDKWDSWSATFQEARDLKNSISYMARVRNSEGEEWVADTNAIMQEVQLLKLKLESSN